MKQAVQHLYEFGPFRIDPAERLLLRSHESIPLTAKAFDTLLLLVQRTGHLVEKSELISAVWTDSFVEEGNLTVVICTLRKALGDDNGERKYIQTVAKRGYRFVGEVREIVESEPQRPMETLTLDRLSAVSQQPEVVSMKAGYWPLSSAAKVALCSLLVAAAVSAAF